MCTMCMCIYIYIYRYLYIYVVRLGSGPISAVLKVRFWTNCLDVFQSQRAGVFSFVLGAKKVNKMKVRFLDQDGLFLDPKLVQDLTFTLVQNLTFKNGPLIKFCCLNVL